MSDDKRNDKHDEFPVRNLIYMIIGTVAIAVAVALTLPLLS